MKENINEHDMTKKMMSIIRGGYKAKLLNEQDENKRFAKAPREGHEPLIELTDDYAELPKSDSRVSELSNDLQNIAGVDVTSVFISRKKDLVINGEALKYQNSGLYFTMALSQKDVITTMENIKGDEANSIIDKLNGFLGNLRANPSETKEYLYNEKEDKGLFPEQSENGTNG